MQVQILILVFWKKYDSGSTHSKKFCENHKYLHILAGQGSWLI